MERGGSGVVEKRGNVGDNVVEIREIVGIVEEWPG